MLKPTDTIKVLTQREAIKQYPKEGFEKYDPMVLMVGTRKAFTEHFRTAVGILIDDELVYMNIDATAPRHITGNTLVLRNREEECRVVVWLKEDEK